VKRQQYGKCDECQDREDSKWNGISCAQDPLVIHLDTCIVDQSPRSNVLAISQRLLQHRGGKADEVDMMIETGGCNETAMSLSCLRVVECGAIFGVTSAEYPRRNFQNSGIKTPHYWSEWRKYPPIIMQEYMSMPRLVVPCNEGCLFSALHVCEYGVVDYQGSQTSTAVKEFKL
jgi:hypothetical protein